MSQPPRASTTPARPPVAASSRFSLEYLGFHNEHDRREYRLRARFGEDVREYTVWIALAAFAAKRVLLQDGPDICFQKLWRELAVVELKGTARLAVTDDDLASYRDAHAVPARRPSFTHAARTSNSPAVPSNERP
jgi:hypothetical protein